MSIDLSSCDDDRLSLTEWLRDDRVIDFRKEMEKRITQFLFSQDSSSFQFQQIMIQLARMGSHFENQFLLERDIAQLNSPFEIVLCKNQVLKWANKVGHFFDDHKAEIAVGLAICAAGVTLGIVTGYALSFKVGGVVVAGANSIFQKEEKPNPRIPKNLPPLSARNIEIASKACLPKLELPPSTNELIVTKDGVWVQGQFFPTQETMNFPQANLEAIYGKEYISELYRRFDLPDPYAKSSTQEIPLQDSFAKENPSFVQHIEESLREVRSPHYQGEVFDPNYWSTLQDVKKMFPQEDTLSSDRPNPPFVEVPRLGKPEQKTVHFHCGIANNFSSVVEGGLQLGKSLNQQFAIQPHLLHSNNLVEGLIFVGAEKGLAVAGISTGVILQHSQIQKSIDYEVENLSRIAQDIIKQNNPKLKQVHVTFSNGGYVFKEALKQLPPEYRNTIIVVTAGTTSIIDDDLACKVYNIIGSEDWPSKLCNGGEAGIEAAKERATVRLIPQNETQAGIGGHYCTQPDYQDEVSEFIEGKIVGKYEIY